MGLKSAFIQMSNLFCQIWKFMERAKFIFKRKSIYFIIIGYSLLLCGLADAHRPHDNIVDLAISPDFSNDGIAFAIVMHRTLFVTRDYGNTWKTLNKGLDNVHPFTSVSVSPAFHKIGTIFVSSEGDGVYRSNDGGKNWFKVNSGIVDLDIQIVRLSPFFEKSSTVLAADAKGRLYRTTNNGKKWELILSNNQRIHSIAFLPPAEKERILIGDSEGKLALFDGSSWKEIISRSEWGFITCLTISPEFESDSTYWLGTETSGIFKTSNNGQSFVPSDSGVSEKRITSIKAVYGPGKKPWLYATTWNQGIFCSKDGGGSWKIYDNGLTTDPQADMPNFLLPHFKGIEANKSFMLLGGFDGLFFSKDRGESWRQLETWSMRNISTMSVSPVLDQGQQSAILAYGGGAYLIPDVTSQDWFGRARSLTLAGVPGVRKDKGISDIAFSPSFSKDQTIFAAAEQELLRSETAGRTWSHVAINKPFKFRVRKKIDYYLRKLGFSKSTRLNLVGFFPLIPGWSSYAAISPDFSKDGTVFFGTQGLGQCRSKDGGKSCSVVMDTSLRLTTSMAISPDFSHDKTLFIGIQKDGVYKTQDGGDTFRKLDPGLLPVGGQLKLAISPRYGSDHIVLVGTGKGLFISKDGGNRWAPVGKGNLPDKGTILSVAISPDFKKDQTVLVAVKGYGIYKSMDAAQSFSIIGEDLLNENVQLKQLIFSGNYTQDQTVFGVSLENVWYSHNGGQTWKIVKRLARYEDVLDIITYTGEWETVRGGDYSDSTQTRSKILGSKASLRFNGSGIRLIGERSSENGSAKVLIEGQLIDKISFKSETYQPSDIIFESTGLSKGNHEITVEVISTGENNGWVTIDAFEILP